MLWNALQDSKGGVVFGAGAGHIKGGTFFKTTKFYDEHVPLLFGTRMHSIFIILPLGLLGFIWMFFWYKHCLNFRNRYGAMAFKIKMFLLFMVIVSFFYQETFRLLVPCAIFYYLCLSTSYPCEPKIKNGNTSGFVHNSTDF